MTEPQLRTHKVVLLLLGVSVMWADAAEKQEVSQGPKEEAVTLQRATEASPIVVQVVKAQSSQEEKQDRDEGRRAEAQHAAREESLVSWTRKLANYTLGLTVGTLLLAAATAVLVILGFRQIAEARESISASRIAAEASQRS